MLPFKNRLVKRKDFDLVQRRGRHASFENISVKVLENGMESSRIGIVVGLKFSKKAVERNAAKRAIREVVHKELKKIKKGIDIVIFVRKREQEKFFPKKINEQWQVVAQRLGLKPDNK